MKEPYTEYITGYNEYFGPKIWILISGSKNRIQSVYMLNNTPPVKLCASEFKLLPLYLCLMDSTSGLTARPIGPVMWGEEPWTERTHKVRWPAS